MNINQKVRNQMDRYFDRNDIFLKSFSEFTLDAPLLIQTKSELFEVSKGYRDAYKFEITCKVHQNSEINESNKKKVLKFSSKNSSYLKLVERFGLSQEAKCLYKGLGVYGVHFTGQANLTVLKWEQKDFEHSIVAASDFGKDLIFQGIPVACSKIMKACGVQLYKSLRKNDEFIVTYSEENSILDRKAHSFKIINSIDLLLGLNDKESLVNQLNSYENYWDFKYVF